MAVLREVLADDDKIRGKCSGQGYLRKTKCCNSECSKRDEDERIQKDKYKRVEE
jgi:hypothetical protein